MSGGVVLFLGPTLPAAASPPGWTVRPPARQGDIFRAVRDLAPAAIGLIDGVFLDVPAVWHREILWALDRGVHVLGAASMGALRAAELDRYGMRGVGRIYEAYRDGVWPGFAEPFEDDDEVAVVHAPMAAGGAALSDAMVDLRATLGAAVAAGQADPARCRDLAARMKALAFPDRCFAALTQTAGGALGDWIAANKTHQKRNDALALIDAIGAIGSAPFAPSFRFTRALVWERFVNSQTQPSSILARLREADPSAWAALRRGAAGRLAALAALPPADDAAARRFLDDFRLAHGLVRHEDIRIWLGHTGLDAAGLARLMQEEATLDEAPVSPALEAAMLDLLRLSGRIPGRMPGDPP